MKNKLPYLMIGITGEAGSGKDTVAKMIANELLNEHHEPSYSIALADTLKEICANLLGVHLSVFNSRENKDGLYYHRLSNQFVQEVPQGAKIFEMRNEELNSTHIVGAFNRLYDIMQPDVYFKLRDFLQLIGTNLFKCNCNNRIWIDALNNRISRHSNCIHLITDVRFQDEADYVVKEKGGFIVQVMNTENPSPHNDHISENGLHDESFYKIVWDGKDIKCLETQVLALIKDKILDCIYNHRTMLRIKALKK